jgi:hypothetical protein
MAKTKTWDKTVFTILVTVALGLPIIEPNVIPLEAAFQGKMSRLSFFIIKNRKIDLKHAILKYQPRINYSV